MLICLFIGLPALSLEEEGSLLEIDGLITEEKGPAASPRGMIQAISKSGKGGKYQEILKDVKEVLADPARRGELKYHIARIQLLAGNFEQASRAMEDFLATKPKGEVGVNAMVSLASAYLGMGRHDLADGVYGRLFRDFSPDLYPGGLWRKYIDYRYAHVTSWSKFGETLVDLLSSADANDLKDNARSLFNSRLDLDIMDSDRCLAFLQDLIQRSSDNAAKREMALFRAMIFNFDVDDYQTSGQILDQLIKENSGDSVAMKALFVSSFTRGFLDPQRDLGTATEKLSELIGKLLALRKTDRKDAPSAESWILPAAGYLYSQLLVQQQDGAGPAVKALGEILPRDEKGAVFWPHGDEAILYGLCALTRANMLEISIGDLDRSEELYRDVAGHFPRTFLSPMAKAALQRLPKAGRSRDKYLFNIATNYYKQGDIARTLQTYGEISRDYPGSPLAGESILESARIMADDLLDSRSALDLLQKFVQADPAVSMASRAMFKIANILEYIGEYRLAMEQYDKIAAAGFDPILRRQALSRKALILDRKYKKYKESAEIYESILDENQDDRESDICRYNLALLYRDKLKKNDEADKLFRRILADPTSVFRGRAYTALKGGVAPPQAEGEAEQAAQAEVTAPSDALAALLGRSVQGASQEVEEAVSADASAADVASATEEATATEEASAQAGDSSEKTETAAPEAANAVTAQLTAEAQTLEKISQLLDQEPDQPQGETEEAQEELAAPDQTALLREQLSGAAAIGPEAFEETLARESQRLLEENQWHQLSILLQEALPLARDDKFRTRLLQELSVLLRERLSDHTGYEDCLRGIIMLQADRESVDSARVALAECFLGRSDFQTAGTLYSEATAPGATGRTAAQAMLGLADIAFRYSNDPHGSLEGYRQAASMSDDPVIVIASLKGLSRASLECGLLEQAETFLRIMGDNFSDHPEGVQAMLLLANRGIISGRTELAVQMADRVVATLGGETAETTPHQWMALALEFQQADKDPERIAKYREFVNRFPTSSELESVYCKLARALLRQGDTGEASKIYSAMGYMFPRGRYFDESRKFLAIEPRYRELKRIQDEIESSLKDGKFLLLEDLRFREAEILVRDLGKLAQGRLCLTEFIYRYPASPRGQQAREMLDIARGASSFESVMSYVERNPDSMDGIAFLYAMARVFQKDGMDPDRATELYGEIARRYPGSPLMLRVHENMADINEKVLKKFDLAARELEKLVSISSEAKRRMILNRLTRLYSDKLKDRVAARKAMESLATSLEGEEKERQEEAIRRSRAEDRIAEIRRNLFTSAGTEQGRELLLSLGEELEKSGLFDMAVAQYSDYVSLFNAHPTSGGVQLKVASIQDKFLDKPAEAITSYRNYLKNYDPRERRDVISFRIAQLLAKEGRYTEAFKHLELWTSKYRDSKYLADAQKLLAKCRVEKEKEVKSEDEGEFQRKSRYENVTADMLDIQVERYASSLTDQEVEIYKKISELQEKVIKDPGDASAPRMLKEIADIYSAQAGNYRRAIEYLQKIVDYYQDFANASNIDLKAAELADEKLQDFEEALVFYRRYHDRHPAGEKGAFVCFKIAQIYQYRLSDYESSREFYERVFESYPNSEWEDDALYSAALNYSENLKDHERSIQLFQQLIDKYYDSEFGDDSQYRIGMIYEHNLFDFQQAKDAYQKVLDNYSSSSLYNEAQSGVYRMEEYIQRGM